MKMLLVSVAFLTIPSAASLGIGIDVLPEAYTFAARRVGFAADLRLETCTASRCLWALGDGVKIAADRGGESLDIFRIEATLEQATAASSARRYEQACLAIVALVEHGGSVDDLRLAAKAITSPSSDAAHDIQVDTSDRTVSLYGARAPKHDGAGQVQRCGAIAS